MASDLHASMHAAPATACRSPREQRGWEVATGMCLSWCTLRSTASSQYKKQYVICSRSHACETWRAQHVSWVVS